MNQLNKSLQGSRENVLTSSDKILGFKNPHVFTTHCFIHREVLLSKTLGGGMKEVSDVATKMIKFITQRPVHSTMFKKLCENLDKEHISLLLHTEIRWFSRGRLSCMVPELKGELQDYFQENSRTDFCNWLLGRRMIGETSLLS
jgi:hypothetical protein